MRCNISVSSFGNSRSAPVAEGSEDGENSEVLCDMYFFPCVLLHNVGFKLPSVCTVSLNRAELGTGNFE